MGLGDLTLWQPSPTLSVGEAQRFKLVTDLGNLRDDISHRGQKPPHTLYVLDVTAEAGRVMDLGREGGTAGGTVVCAGMPKALVVPGTHTGRALARVLAWGDPARRRRRRAGQRPSAAFSAAQFSGDLAPLARATCTSWRASAH